MTQPPEGNQFSNVSRSTIMSSYFHSTASAKKQLTTDSYRYTSSLHTTLWCRSVIKCRGKSQQSNLLLVVYMQSKNSIMMDVELSVITCHLAGIENMYQSLSLYTQSASITRFHRQRFALCGSVSTPLFNANIVHDVLQSFPPCLCSFQISATCACVSHSFVTH